MNKCHYIRGISLGGFQVFDELTYIPMDRLTLIYGPNSAGKSAIEDAFKIFGILNGSLEDNSFSVTPNFWAFNRENSLSLPLQSSSAKDQLLEAFGRSWRRSGKPARYADTMLMCIHASLDFDPVESVAGSLDRKTGIASKFKKYPIEIELRYQFYQEDDEKYSKDEWDDEFVGLSFAFELWINSEVLLAYRHQNWAPYININHPNLKSYAFETNFQEVALKYPEKIIWENGFFGFGGVPGFLFGGWLKNSFQSPYTGFISHETDPVFQDALKDFSDIFGGILNLVRQNIVTTAKVVPASRQIPTEQDLTFGGHEGCFARLHRDKETWWHLHTEMKDPKKPNADDFYGVLNDTKTLDLVNAVLRTHLFIERGYRIARTGQMLISMERFEYLMSAHTPEIPIEPGMSTFSRFHLEDSLGTKFNFEDVGSGLGYILPVLCAICHNLGKAHDSTSFIQQPELHLHPALQASLGDVFIEASTSRNQILIETHSEYLLLRILKRIRQTAMGLPLDPQLQVKPTDVCVLYFDPLPNGTTTVKRLRISKNGDFMDRWPRGFFAERDTELFDE